MGSFCILRSFSLVLVFSIGVFAMPSDTNSADDVFLHTQDRCLNEPIYFTLPVSCFGETADGNVPLRAPDEFGIKEIVPKAFRARFDKWKAEFLATEFGRKSWERYSNDKKFLLTIVVSSDRKFGAGTDGYDWNSNGELIGATVTLGKDIDKGFPEPIYYPVMNSLSTDAHLSDIGGGILASAKLAHEIGHVDLTSAMDEQTFARQNKLMDDYYQIFLDNGYNTKDARLVKLAEQLGAKPIEIWEDREYWSEVSAMRFLVERLENDDLYCSVLKKMRRNLSDYATNYLARFDSLGRSDSEVQCSR